MAVVWRWWTWCNSETVVLELALQYCGDEDDLVAVLEWPALQTSSAYPHLLEAVQLLSIYGNELEVTLLTSVCQ